MAFKYPTNSSRIGSFIFTKPDLDSQPVEREIMTSVKAKVMGLYLGEIPVPKEKENGKEEKMKLDPLVQTGEWLCMRLSHSISC